MVTKVILPPVPPEPCVKRWIVAVFLFHTSSGIYCLPDLFVSMDVKFRILPPLWYSHFFLGVPRDLCLTPRSRFSDIQPHHGMSPPLGSLSLTPICCFYFLHLFPPPAPVTFKPHLPNESCVMFSNLLSCPYPLFFFHA